MSRSMTAADARAIMAGERDAHVLRMLDTVVTLEAERDGALAHAEELTQALREAQRARDAAAQAFDDLVVTVWRAATGAEHEPPGSTGALVEAVKALRAAMGVTK